MQSDNENIIELLGPQEVIGQAIDLLMDSDDMSRDAAFELLVQGSSESRRKVREVAAEVIRQRQGDRVEPPTSRGSLLRSRDP